VNAFSLDANDGANDCVKDRLDFTRKRTGLNDVCILILTLFSINIELGTGFNRVVIESWSLN
jgi:hypothetical protein